MSRWLWGGFWSRMTGMGASGLLARLGADAVAFAVFGIAVGGALLCGEDWEAGEVFVRAGNLMRLR